MFSMGRVMMTSGVALLPDLSGYLRQCLQRHARGDWGVVDEEDRATNDDAAKGGARVLPAYPLDPSKPCEGFGENTLWIITECDRSVTTLLLPDEY